MDFKSTLDLTEAERHQLLVEWNSTQADYPDVCVHELFEAQVERTPDAIALVAGSQQLTYRELNQRANQLAHYLQALGVKADGLVGICPTGRLRTVERSPDMMVGILAILKAGGAYVPLDSAYPKERLEFMLSNAEVEVLLTSENLLSTLPQSTDVAHVVCLDRDWEVISGEPNQNPLTTVQPNHLAYVIYTSGSTGQPKGVAMEHHSLVNLLWWHASTRTASCGLKTLQFCAISFDFSFHEIFSTLCFGGTLVLVAEEVRRNPFALAKFIHDNQIEKLFLPVTALQQLAEAVDEKASPLSPPDLSRGTPEQGGTKGGRGIEGGPTPPLDLSRGTPEQGGGPTALREVITTGEQLQITPAMVKLFRQTGAILHNHYGATEFQDATTFTLSGDPTDWPTLPPIGRPISNVQIYILPAPAQALDESGQPVPIGEACPEELRIGELCIAGAGVARGYLKRPNLTKEKFISNPFGPGRLYRTGDLARYRANGSIEHLGRMGHQVKIRGFRIELGEIEAVLRQSDPMVKMAVVVVQEDSHLTANKRLVAFVTPEHVDAEQMSSILRQRLPDYMLPQRIITLRKLPLTPSGKIDRRALSTMDTSTVKDVALARTPIEERISLIWQEHLGLAQVDIHDTFFEQGGNSLLAVQTLAQMNEAFEIDLSLTTLFERDTISVLADHIELLKRIQSTTMAHQNPVAQDDLVLYEEGEL